MANAAPRRLRAGNVRVQLAALDILQHDIDLVPPRIFGQAIEPVAPRRLVVVTKSVARRHLEAAVEEAHDTIRRLAGSAEFGPTNQGLVGKDNKLGHVGDRLTVVGGY